jgi:hypothetical protein
VRGFEGRMVGFWAGVPSGIDQSQGNFV